MDGGTLQLLFLIVLLYLRIQSKPLTIDYTIWDESRGTFVTLDLVNNFSINDNFYWNNSADPKYGLKLLKS